MFHRFLEWKGNKLVNKFFKRTDCTLMNCLHGWKHGNPQKTWTHGYSFICSSLFLFHRQKNKTYAFAICWYLNFYLLFQVEQRDVPGIDSAYLAMDTEEGVEVVWNEVQFSERKNFKAQEDKIQYVFENLTQLEHPNIVKFHRYWTDTHNDKPRVSVCYNLYSN